MRIVATLATVAVCVVAGSGLGPDRSSDRGLRELERRVSAVEGDIGSLERKLDDLRRDVERLSGRDPGPRPDLRELNQRLDDLESAVRRQASGDSDAKEKLTSLDRRFDKRTLQLAEWFDEYHKQASSARHHRDRIGGID